VKWPGFSFNLSDYGGPTPDQADRRSACTFSLGIKRLDDLAQTFPGNDLVHLIKKLLAAGRLAVAFKTFVGQSLLTHKHMLQAA
jgi:hypothetical protein